MIQIARVFAAEIIAKAAHFNAKAGRLSAIH